MTINLDRVVQLEEALVTLVDPQELGLVVGESDTILFTVILRKVENVRKRR